MAITIRQQDDSTITIAAGPALDDWPGTKRLMRLEVFSPPDRPLFLTPNTVEQLAEIFKRWGET